MCWKLETNFALNARSHQQVSTRISTSLAMVIGRARVFACIIGVWSRPVTNERGRGKLVEEKIKSRSSESVVILIELVIASSKVRSRVLRVFCCESWKSNPN